MFKICLLRFHVDDKKAPVGHRISTYFVVKCVKQADFFRRIANFSQSL